MAQIERFEDIEGWKLGRRVTNRVYDVTSTGDFSRDLALANQIRRASISIMSNIAEGFERDGNKEFLQFLSIAKGSCGEVRSQMYIAADRKYVDETTFNEICGLLIETSQKILGIYEIPKASGREGKEV